MSELRQNFTLSALPGKVCAAWQARPNSKRLGDFYNAGNGLLLVSGAASLQPHAVIGAATFIATGTIYSLRGSDDRWFALACGTGSLGMLAANYPAIAELAVTHTVTQPATLFGTSVFLAASAFGALKPPLERAFKNAKNAIVRHVLGKPRQMMGILSGSSKIFMLYDAVATRNVPFGVVLAAWLVGDYYAARSAQPPRTARRANPADNALCS